MNQLILRGILIAMITNTNAGEFPRDARRSVIMDVKIRHARPEDAPAIAEIHVRTWQSAYRGLLPDDALAAMTPEQRLPMWERLLAALPDGHGVLVAESDGAVVGFSSFGPRRNADRGDELELFTIYVDPTAQHCGIGTSLLQASLAAMREAGAARAVLWVLDGNETAQRFYRRSGWVRGETTKDETLWGVTVRELDYTIDLGPGRGPGDSGPLS